ncbi:MAG: alpha/beta fold hydrolase [Nanoarchaeota archaeon]|nr:alpha/beta fold hydrolase [Nanoarchaeota archaeon]
MQRKVEFQNKKGEKIVGILHEPKEKTDKVMIIAHTFKGDKDYQPIIEAAAEFLSMNKIAVLRFDFAGCGESEGDYKDATISSEVEDLKAAIEFVEKLGYKKIGLIGFSMGATVSIIAYDSKIKTLVLWSPLLNPKIQYERYKKFEEELKISKFIVRERKIDKKKVRVGYNLFKEWGSLNMIPFIETVDCPVLSFIASEDKEVCNREENLKMFKFFPNPKNKLVIVEGVDHDYLDKEKAKKVILATRNWLRKWL